MSKLFCSSFQDLVFGALALFALCISILTGCASAVPGPSPTAAQQPTRPAAATQYSNILKALPGAFGTATNDHIALELPKFNQDKVDGLTFAQVLGNWYFNRSGPKVVVAPLQR